MTSKKTFLMVTLIGAVAISAIAATSVIAQPNQEPINKSGLTDVEQSLVMQIVQNDQKSQRLLDKGSWKVLGIGEWDDGNPATDGAFALIRFDERQWIEDEFINPISGERFNAKQWSGSLHAFVDLTDQTLVEITPVGISKAPDDNPMARNYQDPKIAEAEQVAIQHEIAREMNGNIQTNLNGIRQTPSNPDGIAFIGIYEDNTQRGIVAVDLADMSYVEKYSVKVLGGNR